MIARLLLDPPTSGSRNMAVDEALLAAAAEGTTTLRIYAWSPATLSLGYFQAAVERQQHLPSAACDVVRRASGGGAILHDHELTYSLTIPHANRFGGKAAEIYRLVHRSLIETLATWNVRATLFAEAATAEPREMSSESEAAAAEPFLCFQRRSAEDIVVRGAKMVGSAQRRHQGALLQHGSVLLRRSTYAPEVPGLADVADLPAESFNFTELQKRWLPILERTIGLTFKPGTLTDEEEAAAAIWETERFATTEWTLRR